MLINDDIVRNLAQLIRHWSLLLFWGVFRFGAVDCSFPLHCSCNTFCKFSQKISPWIISFARNKLTLEKRKLIASLHLASANNFFSMFSLTQVFNNFFLLHLGRQTMSCVCFERIRILQTTRHRQTITYGDWAATETRIWRTMERKIAAPISWCFSISRELWRAFKTKLKWKGLSLAHTYGAVLTLKALKVNAGEG